MSPAKKTIRPEKKESAAKRVKPPVVKRIVTKKTLNGLSIKIYDIKGIEKTSVNLSDAIFNVKAKPQLLSQYVRVFLANQRQGSASTKTRGEVTGSTRKIYRQKGTGKARHGDIKAPVFVGGGVAGGPKPRDYSLQMNKKQKLKALFYSLSLKQKENMIIGLEKEALTIEPKTKTVFNFIKIINPENNRLLFVLPKLTKNNFVLASGNIPRIVLTDANSLNAYEVLKAKKIIFFDEALSILEEHFIEHDLSAKALDHSK